MYEPPTHDRLSEMLDAQRRLQLEMPPLNRDPSKLQGEERIQFFRDMREALEAELQEMMDEMGWKPWASSRHFNEQAVRSELVDVWHFFMNLWLASGGDAEMLYRLYREKREKNSKRQKEGYDGVSTKCPGCKRAYDDDHVGCYPPTEDGRNGFCTVLGKAFFLFDTVTPGEPNVTDN